MIQTKSDYERVEFIEVSEKIIRVNAQAGIITASSLAIPWNRIINFIVPQEINSYGNNGFGYGITYYDGDEAKTRYILSVYNNSKEIKEKIINQYIEAIETYKILNNGF